jgi:hypothetical protein
VVVTRHVGKILFLSSLEPEVVVVAAEEDLVVGYPGHLYVAVVHVADDPWVGTEEVQVALAHQEAMAVHHQVVEGVLQVVTHRVGDLQVAEGPVAGGQVVVAAVSDQAYQVMALVATVPENLEVSWVGEEVVTSQVVVILAACVVGSRVVVEVLEVGPCWEVNHVGTMQYLLLIPMLQRLKVWTPRM